ADPTPNPERPTLNARFRRSESNIKHQTSNMGLVVYLLPRACAWFSCQRTDCVDTAADRRCDNHLYARLAAVTTFQVCGWCCSDACGDRALGSSGAYSNAWRILYGRDWTTCREPFAYDIGRSRREFARHVRAAIAVLFCHRLHQFLSMVAQVAVGNSHTMAKKRNQSQRRQLQRKSN